MQLQIKVETWEKCFIWFGASAVSVALTVFSPPSGRPWEVYIPVILSSAAVNFVVWFLFSGMLDGYPAVLTFILLSQTAEGLRWNLNLVSHTYGN